MVPYIPPDYTAVRGGLGCDSKLLAQAFSIPSRETVTCATLSRPGARTVRLAASHSALRGSPLSLPHLPIASGKWRKVACLLQTASETCPEELPHFRVHEQSSRDARGNLRTLPIELLLLSIVMPLWMQNVQRKM